MPFNAPNVDMLGVALVVVASLALIVTLASRSRSDKDQSTSEEGLGIDGEPSAVIPTDAYRGATDRRIRELEGRVRTLESEMRRINYELTKK